jgi:hypothetical protein
MRVPPPVKRNVGVAAAFTALSRYCPLNAALRVDTYPDGA